MSEFLDTIKAEYKKNFRSYMDKSAYWFASTVSKMNINLYNLHMLIKTAYPEFGKMYLFSYDPKHRNILPYYDTFPLVIPMEPRKDGFLGLNLHYIRPEMRIVLLDMLGNNNIDDLFVSYYQIKNNPIALPCVKRYLFSHVQSKYMQIQPEEFKWIVYLSLERFMKKSKYGVWNDSSRKYGGTNL